jgi:alkanesulfonate monooxygenase SsuD/methylene tetrahydromethanopterin reductase-like flavin-dependent oxidoreductase (luciferase family)
MAVFGISDEGYPDYEYERVNSSIAVPSLNFNGLIENRGEQVKNMIEIGDLADDLGYDYIVHPEHHFRISGNTSPNPILLQTSLASRTTNIRLLQMGNILPWHDPIRLAEQINMLDVISDGRAEVGIAHGSSEVEANVLGSQWGASADDQILNDVSFREKYRVMKNQWTDATDTVRNTLHNDSKHELISDWEHTSDTCRFDEDGNRPDLSEGSEDNQFQVDPSPVQEPHPQLWTPTMKEHSLRWAANRGINGCVHLIDFEKLKDQVSVYHRVVANTATDDDYGNGEEDLKRGWDETCRRGIIPIVQVFNTEAASEEAIQRWNQNMAISLSDEETTVKSKDVLSRLESRDNPMVGDSADITRELEEMWETAGYEDKAVFLQFKSGGISHETHVRQVRSFINDVAPNFG